MIVRYTETAERQLVEIWRFSRERWGEVQADRYVATLYDTVRLAAEGRRHMRPRPDERSDLSVIRSGSHHIYLALDAQHDVMQVVAILHQRMEPTRHIKDEGS